MEDGQAIDKARVFRIEIRCKSPAITRTQQHEFSKSSIKSQSRKIIEDEDSEYATAEPDEDLYSLVGDGDQDDMYDNTTFTKHINNSLPVVASVSRLAQIKLQRSFAFDDGGEDPYEETPNDQYDQLDIPRSHRMLFTSGDGCCDGKKDEDLYDLTDDCEYDIADNTRRHVGESLHRSQSQDKLTGTINGGETISEKVIQRPNCIVTALNVNMML
jgi:hypothetical protein